MSSHPQPAFVGTLIQPLNFGNILEICGKIHRDADSVIFNFSKSKITSETSNNNDKYLQFHLDFMKKKIVFSQFNSEHKNNDEITKELVLGEFINEFKFYIMLAETKFHIALNNKPLINFKYNLNLAELQIQVIEITGKLDYLKQLDHHKYFPNIWPPIQIIDDYLDFSNDQPISFNAGHVIILKARLEGNSKGRFIIHFLHARDNKRQELHFSVRFDKKKIIRNSKFRQADEKLVFGEEEISDTEVFPFEDFNKPFTLAIAFTGTEFRIAKDGQFLFNFSYRSPDVLRNIMGPKIFGTNGVNVRVFCIEHFCLEDEICQDFEKFSE